MKFQLEEHLILTGGVILIFILGTHVLSITGDISGWIFTLLNLVLRFCYFVGILSLFFFVLLSVFFIYEAIVEYRSLEALVVAGWLLLLFLYFNMGDVPILQTASDVPGTETGILTHMMAGGLLGYLIIAVAGIRFLETKNANQNDLFYEFMMLSYKASSTGCLERIGDETGPGPGVSKQPYDEWINTYYKYQNTILKANKIRAFDKDEFLVEVTRNGYVLTNKSLFVFKPAQVIDLKDILSYTPEYKLLGNIMTFKLKSNKTIDLKIGYAIEPDLINQLLENNM